MKFRLFLIISISILALPGITRAEGSCSIDGQLSPKLTEYVNATNTLVSSLRQKTSSCGGKRSNGLVSNTKRTLDVIDKAKAEIPVMGDITLDFEYNISMAFKGESRAAVVENGKIFAKVEQMLIGALDSLANNCNLDEVSEGIIIQRIQLNHTLETLYKETALGFPGSDPTNIPDKYQDVASEIRNTYNPTATQGCKNEYSFEKMSEDIMKRIGAISFGIDAGLKEWKYAIALIRGGIGLKEGEYNELKKRLLIQELQSKGFSAGAINQMVKGYDCVEAAMQGDEQNPALDFARAKAKCTTISVLGVDRFMKEWRKMLLGTKGATTTVSYINRYTAYKNLEKNSVDTATMYTATKAIFSENTFVDDEMVTKLINLHITLLDINDRIEKRIPIMQRNCMKAQVGITGGCTSK